MCLMTLLYKTMSHSPWATRRNMTAGLCVVQAVIEDFAKRFSLPANLCTAWHLGKKLNGHEVLLQVVLVMLCPVKSC